MPLIPMFEGSTFAAVSDVAVALADDLEPRIFYRYASNVDSFIRQTAVDDPDPDAVAGDGSLYAPANLPLLIDGRFGQRVSVLRAGAQNGIATLSRVTVC